MSGFVAFFDSNRIFNLQNKQEFRKCTAIKQMGMYKDVVPNYYRKKVNLKTSFEQFYFIYDNMHTVIYQLFNYFKIYKIVDYVIFIIL